MSKRIQKTQYIFYACFIGMYLFQQIERREDWPFTFFGMYRGGRAHTTPFYRFITSYREDDSAELVNPYSYKVDFFFLDEKIRSILLGSREGFNNDLLQGSSDIDMNKLEEVKGFLHRNVAPLLKEQCDSCSKGVLSLRVQFWKSMDFSNFLKPDQEYTYVQVGFNK